MLAVRPFEESDGPAVREMMSALARLREESAHKVVLREQYSRFFVPYMMGLLSSTDALVRVAEDDGEIVGYAVATRSREQPQLRFKTIAVLNDVFVRESHRNQGVAHKLLEEVRSWARESGMDALEVQVNPAREREIRSLEGLGFIPFRIQMINPLEKAAE